VAGLRVAARSLARGFKGDSRGSLEIGKRLHVRYVLDGGVRVAGNRRRVSVQLTDVSTGIEVWSAEYNPDFKNPDIFAIQDSIAGKVVASLRVHLSPAARAALTSRSTENPEAHDLYLKGRFAWGQRAGPHGPLALIQAIAYFKESIALDSNYALAWAGLADAYSMMPGFGDAPPAESFTQAKAAAQRALTLDSTLAEVHASLGIIATFHDWDWPTADREFRRALAIDSTNVLAHQFRAQYFHVLGQTDSSLAELRRALRLEPHSLLLTTRVGTLLMETRRYKEAEEAYDTALAREPKNASARGELGYLLAIQHRFPESFEQFRMILVDSNNLYRQGGYQVAAPLGYAYAIGGRQAEARQIVRDLEKRRQTKYVMPQSIAFIALGLGDTARALDELERGFDERSFLIPFLDWPFYDPLRGNPRFQRMVKEIGVVLLPVPGEKRN
jgi:serine/threonine-protein kinase